MSNQDCVLWHFEKHTRTSVEEQCRDANKVTNVPLALLILWQCAGPHRLEWPWDFVGPRLTQSPLEHCHHHSDSYEC